MFAVGFEFGELRFEIVHTLGERAALPLGAGGVFELWVYYTGPAPAVAYSLDGGDYQALTPVETGSGVNSDGEACGLLRFLIPDAAEKTLSLRFTLSSSDTLVRECCGILL